MYDYAVDTARSLRLHGCPVCTCRLALTRGPLLCCSSCWRGASSTPPLPLSQSPPHRHYHPHVPPFTLPFLPGASSSLSTTSCVPRSSSVTSCTAASASITAWWGRHSAPTPATHHRATMQPSATLHTRHHTPMHHHTAHTHPCALCRWVCVYSCSRASTTLLSSR